ncbi:cAMP-binding domain of CRP or a regulatory subunit of cAMP-dependent protein kinases [Clostridium cavendishii DSM 21758]|uniref:cAMP-binding domain of CRP or a regulatory subunit of cAMP-dependent protein kinases n=1 Tax=Clostridium cavendishii DSM 21758 TaxID=1121302 RepID=A0A1M6FMI9_9CLOT|nr:cyclic nucleotide-binding domain-containing protein [Clostridium cavendishii]SHI98890.1 cAMP-binding domain of CRP or a regulatory subunit of cAMP-dependent protein kinases [Clostridium cavendishii DSM 21758]
MNKIYDKNLIHKYLNEYKLNCNLNKDLIANMEIHNFKKGEMICCINTEMFYMYFLVQGKTKVYTMLSTGKSLLLCFNNPLSIMGDIEFTNNPLADCNVMALEDCICLAISINKIKMFGFNDPIFLRFIIDSLGAKLRNNSIYSSINILYPLENRFASYLLSVMTSNTENNNIVHIEGLNHIAELLGTSYRHLNRVIKDLSDKKIIKKSKNLIIIYDLYKIKSLAQDIYNKNCT